jgi:hypothetical protein
LFVPQEALVVAVGAAGSATRRGNSAIEINVYHQPIRYSCRTVNRYSGTLEDHVLLAILVYLGLALGLI